MYLDIKNKTLTSCRRDPKFVIVPPGVEVIGGRAFRNCQNLKQVILPSSVTRIEEGAFKNCRNLQFVLFSRNLQYIGKDAFSMTPWLNQKLRKEEFVIVNQTLIACRAEGDITIPSHVTYVTEGAFDSCAHVNSIIIPEQVKTLFGLFGRHDPSPEKICIHGVTLEWERVWTSAFCEVAFVIDEKKFSSSLAHRQKEVNDYIIWRMFCADPKDAELSEFASAHIEDLFPFLLEEYNAEMLQFMLDAGLCEDTNFDRLIRSANEHQCYEIQVMLMAYKTSHVKPQTVEEINKNKFDL